MIPAQDVVTLMGGPCDGERVPPFTYRIHIPLAQGSRAHFGEAVTEIATYQLSNTEARAYYIEATK